MVQKSFTDDTAVIYGVISQGHICAMKNVPGINTRVTRFIDWIKKRMSLPTPPPTMITTTTITTTTITTTQTTTSTKTSKGEPDI